MLLVLDTARNVKVTSNIKLNLRLFFFFERSEICCHVSLNGTQKRGRIIITSSNGKIPPGGIQASRLHDTQNSAFIFLWKTRFESQTPKLWNSIGPEVTLLGQHHESNRGQAD